jgi:hypothetical protein
MFIIKDYCSGMWHCVVWYILYLLMFKRIVLISNLRSHRMETLNLTVL